MAKSEHPALLKKALKRSQTAREGSKRNAAALRDFSGACAAAAKDAREFATAFERFADEYIDRVAAYAEACVEIEALEEQDPKGADPETQKKLKKLIAQAEARREACNATAQKFEIISQQCNAMIETVSASADGFNGFSANK